MDPFTIALVAMTASTAISTYSSLRAGASAAGTAAQQAEQIEINRRLEDVNAKQQALARSAQYDIDMSTNAALFAFAGRDASDRSVKAFMESQRNVLSQDNTRLAQQSQMKQSQLRMQAAAERSRGRQARTQSYLNAAITLTNFGAQAAGTMTPAKSADFSAGGGYYGYTDKTTGLGVG